MNPQHLPPNNNSGHPFNLRHAIENWRENIPDKGERIVALRSMLYDCRDNRWVSTGRKMIQREYPVTAACLQAMLAEEVSIVEAELTVNND